MSYLFYLVYFIIGTFVGLKVQTLGPMGLFLLVHCYARLGPSQTLHKPSRLAWPLTPNKPKTPLAWLINQTSLLPIKSRAKLVSPTTDLYTTKPPSLSLHISSHPHFRPAHLPCQPIPLFTNQLTFWTQKSDEAFWTKEGEKGIWNGGRGGNVYTREKRRRETRKRFLTLRSTPPQPSLHSNIGTYTVPRL